MPALSAARRSPIRLVVALVLAALPLGACNNSKTNPKLTIEQLTAENQELRDRNEQVEKALNDAESRAAALAAENDSLRAGGVSPAGGNTGFEGTGGEVSTRGSDIVVSVAGDVLFASGSVTLKQSAKRTLDEIASVINSRYGGSRIEVAGHTDSDPLRKTKGKWTDNENLSAQRALAVERYLAEKGVSRDRMHISGYGPAQPRGNKQQSRRVEIVVLGN